ncbi:MAG: MBL fold metallo-hydrolase [Pseudomonadota bacterium]
MKTPSRCDGPGNATATSRVRWSPAGARGIVTTTCATFEANIMSDASELVLEQIEIGPMKNFTYVVGSRSTREVALVDPAWDVAALVQHVRDRGFEPVAALITHYHPDHCGGEIRGHAIQGVSELLERESLPVYINKREAEGLKKITGLQDADVKPVDTGDRLSIGPVDVEFLHTPGHTPGSQCFRIQNTLVSGDTLFVQGCGRVDLPGSDVDDMHRSLQKLAELPDETLLFPGHNYGDVPNAVLGDVKQRNFYMRVPDIEVWRKLMEQG